MNKKDIAEIKKNFADENGFFNMQNVVCAYFDADKNILCKSNRLYVIMPQEECELILLALKKTLSGSIGKNLLDYPFPQEQYEDGGSQKLLYSLLKSELKDEALNDEFLKKIADNIDYPSTFAVYVAFCKYSVMQKDKNEEAIGVVDRDYNFIVTAFCPVDVPEDSLVYNDIENVIEKNKNIERVISKKPQDGFVYPIFSDNGGDINHVLYYTGKPKEPNLSIVNDILGCEFNMTAIQEKNTFINVLSEVAGSELDYTVITSVNESIKREIAEESAAPDYPVVDSAKLKNILSESGISEQKLQNVGKVFKEKVGDRPLTATNLVQSRTVITSPGITLSVSKEATDKVKATVLNGQKCLVVYLDEPTISVNGIETTVE